MSNERSPRALCSMTIGTSGMGYPFDNWLVVTTIATSWLSTVGWLSEEAARAGYRHGQTDGPGDRRRHRDPRSHDRRTARGCLGSGLDRAGARALARARRGPPDRGR